MLSHDIMHFVLHHVWFDLDRVAHLGAASSVLGGVSRVGGATEQPLGSLSRVGDVAKQALGLAACLVGQALHPAQATLNTCLKTLHTSRDRVALYLQELRV